MDALQMPVLKKKKKLFDVNFISDYSNYNVPKITTFWNLY